MTGRQDRFEVWIEVREPDGRWRAVRHFGSFGRDEIEQPSERDLAEVQRATGKPVRSRIDFGGGGRTEY